MPSLTASSCARLAEMILLLLLIGCLFCPCAQSEEEDAPAQPPLLVQEVTIDALPEGSPLGSGKASVIFEAYFPEGTKGYRFLDSTGTKVRANTVSRKGSKVLIHLNACPGDKLTLEAMRTPVRNSPALHKNGLFRVSKPYSGKEVKDAGAFLAEWRAGGTEHAAVEKQVFSGANTLGPNRNCLTAFNGFIDIAEAGIYIFTTASTDASFILIDGHVVAAAPGRHDVYSCLRGEHSGSVKLTKGVHAFNYYHANGRDDYFAIAALRPSDTRQEVLPPQAFTPFLGASAKTISGADPPRWQHTGTIEIDGMQLREVTLGDGRKIYFYDDKQRRIGSYTIVCGRDSAPAPQSQASLQAMVKSACTVAKTEPPTPEGSRFLANALFAYNLEAEAIAFLKESVAGENSTLSDSEAMRFARRLLYERLCAAERYDESAELWKALAERRGGAFRLEYARVLFYFLARADEAAEELARLSTEELEALPPPASYRAKLLSADILLATEGFTAAAEAYDAMTPLEKYDAEGNGYDVVPGLPDAPGPAMAAFLTSQRGGNPSETMLFLSRLEELQPQCRLDADLMTKKYTLAARQKRTRYAASLARRVMLLQPRAERAAETLLYLAKNTAASGDKAAARKMLREVLEKYPVTAAALQAEKALAEMK